MEELEITYPYFVPFNSEAEALAKIEAINEALRPTWTDGTTNNYDNPRVDESGKFWVIVGQHVEKHFTEEEIKSKANFEDIVFPITN